MRKLNVIWIIAVTLLCSDVLAQVANKRDGNWWRGLDRDTQTAYVVGFYDGMYLGHEFSYWKYYPSNGSEINPCYSLTTDSYSYFMKTYASNVPANQVVDGLNDFYGDYRNRLIAINSSVWIVLNQIRGTPRDQVEKMIENWRKGA